MSGQVGTWRTRGMNAHTTISVDIIDTMLYDSPNEHPTLHSAHATTKKHSQRLQTRNPKLGREQASHEREHGGAGLADARDVAHAAREEPAGEDLGRVVHEDGVHRPEEHADECDRDGVLDERGHDPDGHFEPGRDG